MSSELAIAIRASLVAGEAIMKIYNSSFKVELKEDKTPLTKADTIANNIINTYLTPTKTPIISEENNQIIFEERKNWNQCWIVDPVDGTKEFVKRNGEFTVNIALVENGKPILGVIYVPAEKTLFAADVQNDLAFKSKLLKHESSIDEVMEVSKKLIPKSGKETLIQVVGSRSHMSQETFDYIEEIKKKRNDVEIVSIGSSLKFCLVAEGKADVYPRFAPTMEWDTAAGQAICNAVGIQVISKETNKPLSYNKENLQNPWFIVS